MPRSGFLADRTGWIAWAILFAVAATQRVLQPDRRREDREYGRAAAAWAQERDLYEEGIAGFLYLPQAALLYAPFEAAPKPLGEIVWRLAGTLLLATGLWRLARGGAGPPPGGFAFATLLVLPAAWSSVRNGQTNLHLTGALLHVATCLGSARWWSASAWLVLGLVLKPIAIAFALLAAVLHRATAPRLLLLALLVAVVPFLAADPTYAARQYEQFFAKAWRSAQPGEKGYADLAGLLQAAGIGLPTAARLCLAALAAVGTLLLCAVAQRRGPAARAAFLLFAFGASYLVLFNPRTEANSFVLLAPAVALLAADRWLRGDRGATTWALVVVAVVLGCDNYGRAIHAATDRWAKPLVSLLFAAWLVLRPREPSGNPSSVRGSDGGASRKP
jgi:hypothetical protein